MDRTSTRKQGPIEHGSNSGNRNLAAGLAPQAKSNGMGFLNYIQTLVGARIGMSGADASLIGAPAEPPTVQLVGDTEHSDFRDAVAMIRSSARLIDGLTSHPELIVIAQSRPDVIGRRDVEHLRRSAPLAGIVGLMGTWCEGETRTGRPWPGVTRLYWYEFPTWWWRQMRLRAAGRCPDWARCGDVVLPDVASTTLKTSLPTPSPLRGGTKRARATDVARAQCGSQSRSEPGRGSSGGESNGAAFRSRGVIELCVPRRETAEVLADVLQSAGYATVWHRNAAGAPVVRGVVAGIWDGGQLDDREANDLKVFCRRLKRQQAPVTALLDFPRRDRVDHAIELGVTNVLGKPWLNWTLIDAVESLMSRHSIADAA